LVDINLFFRIHSRNIIWYFWFITTDNHLLNNISIWDIHKIIFKIIIIGDSLFQGSVLYHRTRLRPLMTVSIRWIISIITWIILIILRLHHLRYVTWFLYGFSFFVLRFFVASRIRIFSLLCYWSYFPKSWNFSLYFIKMIWIFFVSKALYTFISHYYSIIYLI